MRKRDFEMKEGQRFGFRKYLGVGLCAVTLGTFFVTNETTVKADTVSDNDASAKSELVQEKADSNTEQQQAPTNTNVQNGKDTAPQTSIITNNANVQKTTDKDTEQLQVETKTAKAPTSTNANDGANNTKQNGDKEVNSGSDTSVQKDDESTTLTVNGQKSEANSAGLTESKIKRTREAPEDNQDVQKFTEHQAINDVPNVEDAGYKDFHPDTKNTLVIVPFTILSSSYSDLSNRPYIIDLTKNVDGTYKKIDLNSYADDIDGTRIHLLDTTYHATDIAPVFYDKKHNPLTDNNLYDPNKMTDHILYFDIKANFPDNTATTYPMSNIPTGQLEEKVKQDPFVVSQNPSQSETPQTKTYHLNNVDTMNSVAYLANTDPISNMITYGSAWINGSASLRHLSNHEVSLILKNVDPSLYKKYLDENNMTSTDQEDPDSIANAFYPSMMYYNSYTPSDSSGKLQQIINQSVILPEYDDQGKIIPNKYAGIVTFDIDNIKPGTYDNLTGENLFNGSMDIKLTYTPLDKDYKNKLAPFYTYDNNGDGENLGWNYFELKQAEPSKPVQPTAPQPTTPTSTPQSSQPTPTPQPTDPTQPTQPTISSQPTTAPQPTQPTQLSTPIQPSSPAPVLPEINPTVPKRTKTSSQSNASHDENTSVRPHGEKTTWNNNTGIHYEHVDSHDSITENKKQINSQANSDKKNYALPQTGSDQNTNKVSIILGGIAAAIGIIGLAHTKKRRSN